MVEMILAKTIGLVLVRAAYVLRTTKSARRSVSCVLSASNIVSRELPALSRTNRLVFISSFRGRELVRIVVSMPSVR
jgi:hypothetical protein